MIELGEEMLLASKVANLFSPGTYSAQRNSHNPRIIENAEDGTATKLERSNMTLEEKRPPILLVRSPSLIPEIY